MASNNIRWKQKDYLTLGRAVANFNKKIRELQAEENALFSNLPPEINYSDIKKEILTRNKLNDILRSLRGFTRETAKSVYSPQAETYITQWESHENILKSKRAEKVLIKRAKEVKEKLSETKPEKKISKKKQAEMQMLYYETLEDLRTIRDARSKSELPYITYKEIISNLGNLDYEMLKAVIYRQNFEHALESYKNFKGYKLLKSKLKRIKNPIEFYNYVKQSEYFEGIFVHYTEGAGIEKAADFDQQRFNEALLQLGLVEEEKNKLVKKYSKLQYFGTIEKYENTALLKKANSIETAEDLFEMLGI